MARGELDERALARSFQDLADQVLTRLPLYRRICTSAAADLEVVRRLELADPDQRVPNLLLAAVHDVLLAGRDDVLADWYPSVPAERDPSGHRSRPVGSGADDPWPHFRRLALDDDAVAERLRRGATQTNEVGRSLALLPALFQVGLDAAGGPFEAFPPLGVVEVGASAGLNLRFGAYGYRYHRPADGGGAEGAATIIESVGSDARLVLDAQLRGDGVPPLPEGTLPVARAVGLDQRPLAVTDPVDARWLVACQWPEEVERLQRLRQAVDLARLAPPTVERGDAVDDLRRHVDEVPLDVLPVIVATWTLCYLDVERQRRFLATLDDLGADRDVALVFAEQPEQVPGLPLPDRPDGQPNGRATALVLVQWRDGERRATRLADLHPHGRWLEWLGP